MHACRGVKRGSPRWVVQRAVPHEGRRCTLCFTLVHARQNLPVSAAGSSTYRVQHANKLRCDSSPGWALRCPWLHHESNTLKPPQPSKYAYQFIVLLKSGRSEVPFGKISFSEVLKRPAGSKLCREWSKVGRSTPRTVEKLKFLLQCFDEVLPDEKMTVGQNS